MKKEEQRGLMHDHRRRIWTTSCAQNEPDVGARCCSIARRGPFLPSLFPPLYAAPLGSPPRRPPRKTFRSVPADIPAESLPTAAGTPVCYDRPPHKRPPVTPCGREQSKSRCRVLF